jgi:IS5 family transposase
MRMRGQAGFFDVDERLKQLSANGDSLERLNAVVDSSCSGRISNARCHARTARKAGRPWFDHVLMFKTLVLQTSHNLSDERTEYLIRDRLSFMRFLLLHLADTVPEANTIWTFRGALTRAQLAGKPAIEALFERFDAALSAAGFLAMSGQIIDASIVAEPKQRNADSESATSKKAAFPRHERQSQPSCARKTATPAGQSNTPKPRPARMASPRVDLAIPAFGYKNHISIDRRHRLIRRWTVTDAARHDGALLPELIYTTPATAPAMSGPTPPIAQRPMRASSPGTCCVRRSIAKSLKASRCRAAPPAPMPANQWYAPRSNTSLPQKGPMGLFIRTIGIGRPEPKSASPISPTTCSEWSG